MAGWADLGLQNGDFKGKPLKASLKMLHAAILERANVIFGGYSIYDRINAISPDKFFYPSTFDEIPEEYRNVYLYSEGKGGWSNFCANYKFWPIWGPYTNVYHLYGLINSLCNFYRIKFGSYNGSRLNHPEVLKNVILNNTLNKFFINNADPEDYMNKPLYLHTTANAIYKILSYCKHPEPYFDWDDQTHIKCYEAETTSTRSIGTLSFYKAGIRSEMLSNFSCSIRHFASFDHSTPVLLYEEFFNINNPGANLVVRSSYTHEWDEEKLPNYYIMKPTLVNSIATIKESAMVYQF